MFSRPSAGRLPGPLVLACLPAAFLGAAVLGSGCAPPPPADGPPPAAASREVWSERPNADADWRPHLLQRCRGGEESSLAADRSLAFCYDSFRAREGSDAIMTLELHLQEQGEDGLVLLTLAQLYLMAGQGEPELLPAEGPAADVGDWPRNRRRLLGRAGSLLERAGALRPDDSAVDYLLADVARARGDTAAARAAWETGHAKCSLPRSFDILRDYQMLAPSAARLVDTVAPEYPEEALRRGATGEVVLDLLIDPRGRVVQTVPVASPDPALTGAARAALEQAGCEPARIGKYPLWSWLRVPTQFSLATG